MHIQKSQVFTIMEACVLPVFSKKSMDVWIRKLKYVFLSVFKTTGTFLKFVVKMLWLILLWNGDFEKNAGNKIPLW